MDNHRKVSPDAPDGQGYEASYPQPPLVDDAAVLAMPLGPRPGEPLPPQPYAPPAEAYATASTPPVYPQERYPQEQYAQERYPQEPPAFPQEAAPTSALAAPTSAHAAPTSGLPYLAGEGAPPPAGRPDPRPVSGAAGWSGGNSAEETQAMRHSTEAIDRAALRRPTSGGPGQLGDGVYRSRRPGMAVAIAAVTVLFELVALRLLASAFFASTVQVGNSIASAFLVVGLPIFSIGLYELLRGAAAAPGAGVRAWLRPPLVYLPVALALFVTAGLAAS